MINKLFFAVVLVSVSIGLSAQSADVVYIDGWVDIKSSGDLFEAQAGDRVRSGDSIITGDDSYAGLEQQDLSTITVKPNSIFTVREMEGENGKETVLSTTLGAVSFKFGKLAGREPVIATPSMTAGVRGTEFAVYAGEDGSSLIAVTTGLVTVSSEGESVDLNADEGVEVQPGKVPGKKFKLKGRELDFSTWNRKKYDALMADSVTGLKNLGARLDSFVENIQDLAATLNEMKRKRDTLRAEMKSIQEKKGDKAAAEFYNGNIYPIEKRLGPVYINIRYYSLSALSFRRFVIGKLYVDMKGRFISDPANQQYVEFLDVYRGIIGKFERDVIPFINVKDI